jgi:hypothetical protein
MTWKMKFEWGAGGGQTGGVDEAHPAPEGRTTWSVIYYPSRDPALTIRSGCGDGCIVPDEWPVVVGDPEAEYH